MALWVSSLFVVTAHNEPTIRPTAAAVSLTALSALPTLLRSSTCLLRSSLRTAWAKSVPLSSHNCNVSAVGLNLHRKGSNANLNPPSFKRFSIISTASPDHPKEPNTPHGLSRSPSFIMAPNAVCTGVGSVPPSVGAPRQNPEQRLRSCEISSGVANSQLNISAAIPVLEIPRAIACAMAPVFPYALAYITAISRLDAEAICFSVHIVYSRKTSVTEL
mmetsp:Transcript_7620/g.25636  ORF Transcript_7620/g.25636 Transcript_7620/m.25636 type:complete len:218 (+) Transcript_7620:476-1129(+)